MWGSARDSAGKKKSGLIPGARPGGGRKNTAIDVVLSFLEVVEDLNSGNFSFSPKPAACIGEKNPGINFDPCINFAARMALASRSPEPDHKS